MSLPPADMSRFEMQRRTMEADLKEAIAVRDSIENAGDMDPELGRELANTISTAEKVLVHMKKVEELGAKRMEPKELEGVDSEMRDLDSAADGVRYAVHPHGAKWWR